MQFAFWVANHSLQGQRSLEDPMMILGNQLRALGHDVVWDPSHREFAARESGINVLVEGFTPEIAEVVGQFHARGARFICVATEEPTPTGFNHGRDGEMVRRQEAFPLAARYFEAILHLVPGDHVTRWYAQHAPAAYVELGYAPALVRGGDGREPEYDFGFFGSITRRRMRLLKRLARAINTAKAVRIAGTFPTQEERDRIMREARVIVQLRKHEEMGLVSSSRCNTALCLGRPVVAEPHLLSEPWDRVVTFTSHCERCAETPRTGREPPCDACVDRFVSAAIMTRAAWRGVHAAQFARFKELLTPEYCVGRALREVGLDLGPATARAPQAREAAAEAVPA